MKFFVVHRNVLQYEVEANSAAEAVLFAQEDPECDRVTCIDSEWDVFDENGKQLEEDEENG